MHLNQDAAPILITRLTTVWIALVKGSACFWTRMPLSLSVFIVSVCFRCSCLFSLSLYLIFVFDTWRIATVPVCLHFDQPASFVCVCFHCLCQMKRSVNTPVCLHFDQASSHLAKKLTTSSPAPRWQPSKPSNASNRLFISVIFSSIWNLLLLIRNYCLLIWNNCWMIRNTCQMIRLNQGCSTSDQIKLTLSVRFKSQLIRSSLEATFTFFATFLRWTILHLINPVNISALLLIKVRSDMLHELCWVTN